ncbi:unnamed protein product [Coregonus sp. 'balchen']|nr:unnamed protein product [Coregonus sp. 'balchen']
MKTQGQTHISQRPAEIRIPSFSKKGTGGLASQAARVSCNPQRGIPGPYDLQSSLIHKHSFGNLPTASRCAT